MMKEKYNYRNEMKKDVIDYIFDNYEPEEVAKMLENTNEFSEKLNDILWNEDSVTGNGSGSYTFNRWQAEENLCHNMDLLSEACEEFCCDIHKAIEMGAEYCDVTIRCYLLNECLAEVLESIKEEVEV